MIQRDVSANDMSINLSSLSNVDEKILVINLKKFLSLMIIMPASNNEADLFIVT